MSGYRGSDSVGKPNIDNCDSCQEMMRDIRPSSPSSHGNKTGRKGDPRMHRAVAARLADPSLSLFEALRAGGFDYTIDEDAQALDTDKVTLGQRKNQLSRRIRLAKKQAEQQPYKASNGAHASPVKYGSETHHTNGSTDNSGKGNAYQSSQASPASSTHGFVTSETSRGLKRSAAAMAQTKGGLLSDSSDVFLGATESAEGDRPLLMAKNHPDYKPLIITRKSGHSGTPAVEPVQPALFHRDQRQQAAATNPPEPGYPPLHNQHQHPQIQQMQSQSQPTIPHQQQPAQAPVVPLGIAPYQQLAMQLYGFNPAIAGNALSHGAPVGNQVASTILNHHASGVATASLTATAQSIGMTLEQLALSLSQSNNLAQVLNSITTNSDDKKSKQEGLALHLFQNEHKSVYTRVMLLAGYPLEEAAEGTEAHLNFALKAWEEEGKRLRQLARKKGLESSVHRDIESHAHQHSHDHEAASPTLAAVAAAEGSNELDALNGGCCFGDGRHVHRLEGCGHTAIVHQPKGGAVHIDFLVGDKIECYQDTKPVAPDNASTAKALSAWPSKYRCEDLSCETQCSDGISHRHSDECKVQNAPKILDRESIDLQSDEWNLPTGEGKLDEPLLGLFKLTSD